MDTSGALPSTYPSSEQLADLAEVVARPAPYVVTVVLDTTAEVEGAAQKVDLRWKNVRRGLAEAGVDEVVLASIDPEVQGANTEGDAFGVVATSEGVLHVEHAPGRPGREFAVREALPRVGPFIAWRQGTPPQVVVLIDRAGADLVAFQHDRPESTRRVKGDDDPLHKPNAGGWSQRRFQQRAANTWEDNAEEVAKAVSTLVQQVDAHLVLAAGDQRAMTLLKQELPGDLAARLQEVSGSRAMDGSRDDTEADRVRLTRQAVHRETVAVLEKFAEERGQGDRAADGPAAALAALAMGQVGTLIVQDDPDDRRTAWFGPDPVHVAADRQTLLDMGVDEPLEGRLVDVCLRAALGLGADVRVLPGPDPHPEQGDEPQLPAANLPTGGIGAILRFSLQ